MNKWYETCGAQNDIVFSTRIRLARNVSGYRFPNKMSNDDKFSLIQEVSDAVFKSEKKDEFSFVDLERLSKIDAVSLVEKHIISPNFAKEPSGRALILKNDESVSIMINEEDHIRIQVLKSGLEFVNALKEAMEIEKIISEKVKFAYDDQFGYLTECPTNVGTGLRASAMVHLPALERVNALERLFNSVSKLGVEVRGTFGEGSKSNNSMYQISNRITLGMSEDEIVDNINSIILQFISKERDIRNSLDKLQIENISYRSFSVLKYARILSSEELFKLLSDLRFGISMNLIDVPINVVNKLNLLCGTAGILKMIERDSANSIERDVKRANFVRDELKGIL